MPAATVGEQWVLVRFRGRPVGVLRLGSRDCSPAELRERALSECAPRIMRHLFEDGLQTVDADVAPPVLTVAVCTRNRPDVLTECLDSLSALDYPPHLLDVVVVDNAPDDDRAADVVRRRFPRFRYVREPRPGLNWARNRAVLEARGAIVAFADDDVIVDRRWAQAIAAVFVREPDAMAVTGLVMPAAIDVPSQIHFERYGGFGRGFDRRYFQVDPRVPRAAAREHAGSGKFGTGANMAFRRSLFHTVGMFDPALDVGTPANGGGDLDMFFRVLHHGRLLVYEPAAIVFHRHRRTHAALREQIANNGVGFYSYLVRTAVAFPELRRDIARMAVWWLWAWNLRRLFASFVRTPAIPRDLIVAELVGSLRGLTRYQRARAAMADAIARFGPQPRLSTERQIV